MVPGISGIQSLPCRLDGDDTFTVLTWLVRGRVSFSETDFEEQNQVLGQVDNHNKLIPEALVVSDEMFTTKPEFQQQKEMHGFDGVQPVQFGGMEKVLKT